MAANQDRPDVDDARPASEPVQAPDLLTPLLGAGLNDLLHELLIRVDELVADQQRLRLLLDAVVVLAADLSLDRVLDRIVGVACDLSGARYGALGVLGGGPGRRLQAFVTHGLSQEERDRIGDLPRGHGLLGQIIDSPQPLRLHDIAEHSASYGFPENHPPMRSFLGVPIRIREKVFGNLYLTEKAGGEDFTDRDEAVVVALAAAAGVVIENAQLY
jgi:GAF domain-containing protein